VDGTSDPHPKTVRQGVSTCSDDLLHLRATPDSFRWTFSVRLMGCACRIRSMFSFNAINPELVRQDGSRPIAWITSLFRLYSLSYASVAIVGRVGPALVVLQTFQPTL
jgi:hypothetical protein